MDDPSLKPVFHGLTLETAISITKSVLLAIGFISTVILFKVAIIPKFASLFIITLPRLFVSFRSWLSPPYVFIVFNFLMVAALASSVFRRQKDTSETKFTPISHENTNVSPSNPYKLTHEDRDFSITGRSGEIWNGISDEDEQDKEEEEEKLLKWDFPTLFTEKFSDPSSEKFCAYSSEKVEEEKDGGDVGDDDSMEATWKAIMERQEKQTPQLKKSQTWDSPLPARLIRAAVREEEPVAWDRNEVRKPEKFQQTLSFRRKISMTSEELKSRAEAFIEMVNRSIRLQRQESEQRFLQAMKRSF
ncbi:DUF4408 domain protein [Cucumis melo var. makuwa]|uniref:DUF4408 domain protein n=3 Tax=Cucumis melo TaxID=3656 RepID=A0A5A7T393_CUCMM|nr:DUF4408 domain protein [Cucumis melo var. makuwa]TYJ98854.1 DUF4408 domain protein [Cucumis melo var. makuwa]